jgi:hypothetical protein
MAKKSLFQVKLKISKIYFLGSPEIPSFSPPKPKNPKIFPPAPQHSRAHSE